MNFQKFVAWEKLPSLVPKTEESSSSASHSGSSDENEENFNEKYKTMVPKVESYTPSIEVPFSVKNVLVKLDAAQLERAKKEISKKLFRILDNVNRTYERYKKGDEFDPKLEKEYLLTSTWEEKNRRSRLLDEVADVQDESVVKVHELEMVLKSLKAWHEMLTKIELQNEDIPTADLIDEMEKRLLKFIDYIDTNVQHLFKICYSFSEQKAKLRRKSVPRVSIFKGWKEKVAENPSEGEPLTPEQMLENEPLAFTRNQDVTNLIQELADSSVFNKAECVAIKYISTMVQNLIKAFAIVTRQCRNLKVKCETLEVLEKKKPDPQVPHLQRELRMAMEKKAALELQVQTVEDKCKVLITTNEVLQKELRDTHEKLAVSKVPVIKLSSEKTTAKPQADMSRKKDEKPFQKPLRTVKSDETRLEREQELRPKEEDSVKEQLPTMISETEAPQKLLVPQAPDSRMKVDTKPQGKDTSPEQVIAKISSDTLQAKFLRKDLSPLKSPEEIISDATITGDTEPAQEASAEKAHGPADKIKAAQDSKWDSRLEEKKKLQKLQIKRVKKPKEEDFVSIQSLEEGPSPTSYDASSEGELSPRASRESVHISSSPEFIERPEGKLSLLSEQPVEVPHSSIQRGETTLQEKLLQKVSSESIAQAMREKKTVKFQDDVLVQSPLTAPDTDEIGGAEVPGTSSSQQPVLERAEDTDVAKQDAAEIQAQECPTGKLKEIQEKKEIKDFSIPAGVPQPKQIDNTGNIIRSLGTKLQEVARERGGVLDAETIKEIFEELDITHQETVLGQTVPAGVPQPKQIDNTGNIIRSLGTKLQEVARERGGVLDAETIKEIFEELDITHQETVLGQMAGSYPRDRVIPRIPLVKRPTLPPFASVEATKKEKSKLTAVEEEPLGQEVDFVLQEFQATTLACLEDKMMKFKKGPSVSGKRLVKFEPTDPRVKHAFKVVDRKLEEFFSLMKQKDPGGPKRQRPSESIKSKAALPEGEDKIMEVTDSSCDASLRLSEESSSSSFSLSGEWEQPLTLGDPLHSKPRIQQSSEQEKEPEQLRIVEEEPQNQQEDAPKLQEEEVLRYKEEDKEQFLGLPMSDEVDQEESRQEEKDQEASLLSEAQEKHFQKEKGLQQMETKSEELQAQSSQETDEEEEAWYTDLQERLQEEHARLQEERQRLDEEAQYLDHMQELFEVQVNQWEEQQQQREEQERLWQMQLKHWRELQREQEEQEQYWGIQREKQKEQQIQLQEEAKLLEQLHKEHLQRQGEQAKEEWRWEQLKAWHKEQQRLWEAEAEEREMKRWQWQQQLADHEEKMEVLQQEYLEQEQNQKRRLQEQQEAQQEQECLWEKRWLEQLKRWRRQLQLQRTQQRNLMEQSRKVQERQRERQVPKEETSLPPMAKMVQGTVLDQLPLYHHKIALLPKGSPFPDIPQLTPSPSTEFEDSSCSLERSWFPEQLPKAMFHAPAITEKRYWIDVGAQRKNLELLKEALKKAEVSSDQYNKAKGIINQALECDAERLALLFRKYIIFCHLQDIRRNLTAQLDAAKYAKDGAKMKDLYKRVEKLDAYYKVVLGRWTVKQIAMEKKHRRCLEKMIAFFAQLRLMTKLHLSSPCPLLIKAVDSTKETRPRIRSVLLKPKVYPSPLISVKRPQDFPYSAAFREPSGEQSESLWKTNITELSIPLGPKTPVSLLWSEACGYPDIPRLLELDISSVRNKPLQDIKTRVQHIPRWKITGYNFTHL